MGDKELLNNNYVWLGLGIFLVDSVSAYIDNPAHFRVLEGEIDWINKF